MGFIIGFGVGMVAGITVAFILAVCSKNAYCNQIEEQERIKEKENREGNANNNEFIRRRS